MLRPDRRELLSYLDGEVDSNSSIDKYAPIEIAMQRPQPYLKNSHGKRAMHDEHDEPMDTSNKHSKLNDIKMDGSGEHADSTSSQNAALKEQFIGRLAKKFDETALQSSRPITENIMPLSEKLTIEKITEIKLKKKVQQRTRVGVDIDDDLPITGTSSSQSKKIDSRSKLFDSVGGSSFTTGIGMTGADDGDATMREIVQRERVCRTRFTVLQSTGKHFDKDISAFLQAIKAKEEGAEANSSQISLGPSNPINSASSQPLANSQKSRSLGYNRFDQERYAAKDETGGFVIDTKLTYQPNGGTISLTPNTNPSSQTTPDSASQISKSGTLFQSSQLSQQKPNVLSSGSSTFNKPRSTTPTGSQPQKRTHSNPIIIIPAARTSLIQMINASDILQDLKYEKFKIKNVFEPKTLVLLENSKISDSLFLKVF